MFFKLSASLIVGCCLLVVAISGAQSNEATQRPVAQNQAVQNRAEPNAVKQSPADLLRHFTTICVRSRTWLVKPEFVSSQLQKQKKFDEWDLAVSNSSDADVLVEVDHQPGWFYYTYTMTHQASGIVLDSGKVTALDGKLASTQIGNKIIKQIARYRELPEAKKR